jgi:hypothetical protein
VLSRGHKLHRPNNVDFLHLRAAARAPFARRDVRVHEGVGSRCIQDTSYQRAAYVGSDELQTTDVGRGIIEINPEKLFDIVVLGEKPR